MALEDAVTIATALEIAFKHDVTIPEAMKAYELLRYNRTVATMKLGEQIRDVRPLRQLICRDGTKPI